MKLLATLLLMLVLTSAAFAQESPVRSLGADFLAKTRVIDEDTEAVLIKFPDRCFSDSDVFKLCAEEALTLESSCKTLRCPVKIVPTEDSGAEVALLDKGALRIYLVSHEGHVVGIGFKRPRHVYI